MIWPKPEFGSASAEEEHRHIREQNGIVRKPLISVDGTFDASIPLKGRTLQGHGRGTKVRPELSFMRFKMGITSTGAQASRATKLSPDDRV